MAFIKRTQAEQAEVLPPEEQDRISAGLQRVGKTSLDECTTEEKQDIYWRDTGFPPDET